MEKIVAFLILIVLMLLTVSCDHTDLYGEILIVQNSAIDRQLPLKLEVPDELREIYRVMWTVNKVIDEEQTMINDLIVSGETLLEDYSEDELKVMFEIDVINFDRIALFMPTTGGKYVIVADGFYKQTNPQAITEIEIEIK